MNAIEFSNALGKVSDKYIMEAVTYERKKNLGWMKWGMMAACFGLVFTLTMFKLPGLMQGFYGAVPPDPIVPVPSASAEPLQPVEEQEVVIHWDKVAVNESEALTTDGVRRYYDPAFYTEETWGQKEIRDYYGWELNAPYIPDGLTGGGWAVTATVWRDKATGELVEDQVGRGFWSGFWEDGSPKSSDDLYIPTGFTIQVSKLGILHCALLPVDDAKTTDFGGVAVTLSHCSMPHGPFDPTQKDPSGLHNMPAGYYDIYVASFHMDGVEYEIEAHRLELEEVVKIIAAVTNPNEKSVAVGGE